MQYSQEHLKTMVYAKFGGQTECIMGNWKIENSVFNFRITLSQADESSSVSLERDYEPVFIHQFQVPWDTAKVSGGHGSMPVKVFLAICCSFFCSVAVSVRADLPEYCGPQNYAYTPLRKDPRGEFTLKQVHIVIRFVASDVQNNMCYVNFYSC